MAWACAMAALFAAAPAGAETDASSGPTERSVEVCVDTPALIFGTTANPTSTAVAMAAALPDEPVVVSYSRVQVELTESYASREPQPLSSWRFAGWDEWTDFSEDTTFACTPEDEGDCPHGIRSRLTGDRYRMQPTDLSAIQVELADDAGTFAGVRVRSVCVTLGYYLASEAPALPDAGPPVQLPDFGAPDESPATDAGTTELDGSLDAPPPAASANADADSGCAATGKSAAFPLWGLMLLGTLGLRRRRRSQPV